MRHRVRDNVEFLTTEFCFFISGPKPGKISERYIHDMIPPKDIKTEQHWFDKTKPNFAIDRDYFLL